MGARATPRAPTDASARLRPLRRLRAWWVARLPVTERWTLTQRNVYILPTSAGMLFAATLLVLLLASINYQLNLGHVLTFLLAGAAGVSMHLTHGNLRGLTLHLRPVAPVFAGEPAALELVLDHSGHARPALAVGFDDPGADAAPPAWCDVPEAGQQVVQVRLVPAHRGWHAVPALRVQTRYPLGLFRAWTVWRPAVRLLAYPSPERPAPPLPAARALDGPLPQRHPAGGGELDGVRPWRRGDTMRQVAWKKVAHTGELVSRDTQGSGRAELWLDWDAAAVRGGDVEARLSRLAAWVLAADDAGLSCGLRLPGREILPGQGEAHRRELLTALALHR